MNFETAIQVFDDNVRSVSGLLNFDTEVRDLAVKGVETLHLFLKKQQGFDNPKWNGENTLSLLRTIRQSPVLRERYATIYNQAVVLLVSYFGSVIGDVFRAASARAVRRQEQFMLDTELKLRVSELMVIASNPEDQLGDAIIRKEALTFQDMQSTHRAFRDFFGVKMEVDDRVRDIIVGQACRHAIVHDGGTANARVLNQIKNANPRNLKPQILLNQKIQFSVEEVMFLASQMQGYIRTLVGVVQAA